MMTPDPADEDEDLRQLIDRPQVRTRTAHDLAVLRAARRSRRPIWRITIPAALAAGLAAVALGLYLPRSQIDDGIVRSRSSVPHDSVIPVVGASLRAPPREFRWPAQSGAQSYRLTLRDASGIVIWRSDSLEANLTPLNHELAAKLTRHTYYWSVEVEREEAKVELGPFWFRLVDP